MIDFLLGVPGKLKTISDYLAAYLSPTRCAKIDNCDTTTSSRAAASTALSSATWTAARAGYLDKISNGGIPGTVKSIQTGYVNNEIASRGAGEDYSYIDKGIAAVSSIAKCVVYAQGPDASWQTARLVSTTSVRISSRADVALVARWTVVEYY